MLRTLTLNHSFGSMNSFVSSKLVIYLKTQEDHKLFLEILLPFLMWNNSLYNCLYNIYLFTLQCLLQIKHGGSPSNRGFAWVTLLRNILKNAWHFDTVTIFLWRDCCQYLVFINCMLKIIFAWIWWVMQKTHLLICIF